LPNGIGFTKWESLDVEQLNGVVVGSTTKPDTLMCAIVDIGCYGRGGAGEGDKRC
jgi:hypothetical protein